MTDLDAIRARLAAATPGPWFVVTTDDDSHMCATYVGTVDRGEMHDMEQGATLRADRSGEVVAMILLQEPRLADHADGRWDENADLIANAPTDIAALLADVAEWQAREAETSAELAKVVAVANERQDRLEAEVRRLQARLEAMEAAGRRVLGDHRYVPWALTGGPDECEHGCAAGIPCRSCDVALLRGGGHR